MKDRFGWSPQVNDDFRSGFKNQGPFVERGVDFNGGDYICNAESKDLKLYRIHVFFDL